MVEEDHFEDGVVGDMIDYGIVYDHTVNTLKEAKDLLDTVYTIEFRPMEEGFDYGCVAEGTELENGYGDKASAGDIEQWKAGKVKLYYAVYQVYIDKVETTSIDSKTFYSEAV